MACPAALLAAVKPSPILWITTILTVKDSRKCLFSLFWMLPVQPFTPRRTKAISVILWICHIHHLIASQCLHTKERSIIASGWAFSPFLLLWRFACILHKSEQYLCQLVTFWNSLPHHWQRILHPPPSQSKGKNCISYVLLSFFGKYFFWSFLIYRIIIIKWYLWDALL